MRLLCDEDIGTGVPKALQLVECDATSLYEMGFAGKVDTFWLRRAGELGWLVFSCNKRMLLAKEERNTIINYKVGILFLTNGEEYIAKVLRLLLVKWESLIHIDNYTPRPFALFLSPNGRLSTKYKHFEL